MINAPYLPDIMANVVGRVSVAFAQRDLDPFAVFFEKGVYSQVAREMGTRALNYPLVWLKMPYAETRGNDYSVFAEVTFDLWLCAATDHKFTQQQREDVVFKPRLLPIYEALMFELGRERGFTVPGPNQLRHQRVVRPYWGGGDTNAPGEQQMFKKHIDAIWIKGITLKMNFDPCYDQGYGVNRNVNYPSAVGQYEFFDDIEIVVGGTQIYDPLENSNTVTLPILAGKNFTVTQRGYGQLRQERDIEINVLPEGGFQLTGGQTFGLGDTYFVRIRPILLT
jgi:hypothetical protein